MDSRMPWKVALAIFLVCFVVVRGQFQLSFGTPTPPRPTTPRPTVAGGYDPACKDKIDNCANYGSDACLGQYRSWAVKNCEATCGFCKPLPTQPPPCLDKLDNCDTFEAGACTNPDYNAWAEENCRRHCRKCTQSQLAVIDAFTTKATTLPSQLCVDKADCRMYGQDACSVDKYGTWGAENCPLFCGICQGVPTPKPLCKDHIPDCQLYQTDICTNPAYASWAYDHCRKFCNICVDTGNPTTPKILTPPPLATKPYTPPSLTLSPILTPPPVKTPPPLHG